MTQHEELIEKLRRLALAATPGPWSSISRASYWGEEEGDVDGPDGEEIRGAEHVEPLSSQETTRGQAWLRDTDYIACAHPQNILVLIDALESQSREIAALKEQEAQLCTLYGLAQAECKRLRKDAERYGVVRRGQHWSVIDGIGDPLTGDRLDAGVDAAIAAKGGSDG